MGAFYCDSVQRFLDNDAAGLMLALTSGAAKLGFDLKPDQHAAWLKQALILNEALTSLTAALPEALKWGILLEYSIPERARRLDAVLLDSSGIIAIEFKIGATKFHSADQWQLREYCWNLRDFHKESASLPIAPILVATEAELPTYKSRDGFEDKHNIILQLAFANAKSMKSEIITAHERLSALASRPIDFKIWNSSEAHPTSTIIEEAQKLFRNQDAREIIHAHSDNTGTAFDKLVQIVEESRRNCLRSICFVTGVPGAGKTLVGLRAAFSEIMSTAAGETPLCFASGNLPLIGVLTRALSLNAIGKGNDQRISQHNSEAPFKDVHKFALMKFLDGDKRPPAEHVVVFDESQRVWTADKVANTLEKRVKRNAIKNEQAVELRQLHYSEPDFLLRVMERCSNWCCIIALIGGGQEIYDGEAGLSEWGRSLRKATERWTIWVSPEALSGGTGVAGQTLFADDPNPSLDVRPMPPLHLAIGKRSFRAERYAEWVNNVLALRADAANKLMPLLTEFPVLFTRDLNQARRLTRNYAGAESRFGLFASSGAMRFRADGIELKRQFRNSIDYADWFLRSSDDVRSSNQLEIAATEFECQGLELDWTIVCWGGDLFIDESNGAWGYRKFVGSRWQNVKQEIDKQYLINTYRVLLTRARTGVVIYVPLGDDNDKTRDPKGFDTIANYLVSCGLSLAT